MHLWGPHLTPSGPSQMAVRFQALVPPALSECAQRHLKKTAWNRPLAFTDARQLSWHSPHYRWGCYTQGHFITTASDKMEATGGSNDWAWAVRQSYCPGAWQPWPLNLAAIYLWRWNKVHGTHICKQKPTPDWAAQQPSAQAWLAHAHLIMVEWDGQKEWTNDAHIFAYPTIFIEA